MHFTVALKNSVVLLLLMNLLACSEPTSEDLWQDYSMRIENVFDVVVAKPISIHKALLPSKKDRQVTLTPPSINLWQFLKMQDCALNRLVAKRNGPLGKVMLPSQTLFYVSEFIPLAEDCLSNTEVPKDLAQTIQTAIDFYQQHKYDYFRNALFHDEFAELFQSNHLWPLGDHFPASGLPALPLWLNEFHQLTKSNWPTSKLNGEALENALNRLGNSRLMGQWLLELDLASQYLHVITDAMNQHNGLCQFSQKAPQRQIMLNVFSKHFSLKIQPHISQLTRFGQRAEQQLQGIMSQPEPILRFYHQVFINPPSPWQRFKRHWQTHVKAWQRQLGQCNAMPGQSS